MSSRHNSSGCSRFGAHNRRCTIDVYASYAMNEPSLFVIQTRGLDITDKNLSPRKRRVCLFHDTKIPMRVQDANKFSSNFCFVPIEIFSFNSTQYLLSKVIIAAKSKSFSLSKPYRLDNTSTSSSRSSDPRWPFDRTLRGIPTTVILEPHYRIPLRHISRMLIKLLMASPDAASEAGTTQARLPVTPAAEGSFNCNLQQALQQALADSDTAGKIGSMTQTRRLLIVDDDADLRHALDEQLALHPEFEVEMAERPRRRSSR